MLTNPAPAAVAADVRAARTWPLILAVRARIGRLQITMAQLIITAVGPDRPGIVGELTAHLHSAGGNILDSRMVNLRGEFAMLILVECSEDAARTLSQDLTNVGERMRLRITLTQQAGAEQPIKGLPYRLKTYSMDQPGIVARL